MRFTTLLAAFALTAAVAAPAFADGTELKASKIRVSDLDLSTPAGQAALRHRIGSAAEDLCGSYATSDSVVQDSITTCRRQVTASIDRQIAARAGPAQLASTR